jgi:hypothetical protein
MSSRDSLALVCTRRGTVLLACRANSASDDIDGGLGDADRGLRGGSGSALKVSRLARTVSSFQQLAASAGSAPCVIDLAGHTVASVVAEAPNQASRQASADTPPAYNPGFLVCIAARTPSAFGRDEIALRAAHIRAALLSHDRGETAALLFGADARDAADAARGGDAYSIERTI